MESLFPQRSEVNHLCTPKAISGSESVTCTNSQCKAEKCEPGYHLYNGECEKDDLNNCGGHGNLCTTTQVEGSAAVKCETGQCIATACDSNNYTMDNAQQICLPIQSGNPCTNSICKNSGKQGVLYQCDLDNGLINEKGDPCFNDINQAISCNKNGTACGSCLNKSSYCTDDRAVAVSCNGGEENREVCSNLITAENQYSFCSFVDNLAQCITDCVTGYHKDQYGNCTIQCQQDEVWDQDQKKCLKQKCIDLKDPKVGDTCIFGHYPHELDNNKMYVFMDLEWQILEIQPESFLMITRYVIDWQSFSSKDENGKFTNIWEKSSIRSWLNGFKKEINTSGIDYTNDNFMRTAFADEEREYIYKVYDNPNPTGETSDFVFLLSVDEAEDYFNSDTERKAYATPYAKLRGVKVNQNLDECIKPEYCVAAWWLRSPGSGNKDECATFVYDGGKINSYGYYAYDMNTGVRPALRLIR